MFKEEIEKAKEAAIVIDESVLLRSSQNVLFETAYPNLPLYHIVYKTHIVRGTSRCPPWVAVHMAQNLVQYGKHYT